MTINFDKRKESLLLKVMDWWGISPEEIEKELKSDHDHTAAVWVVKKYVDREFKTASKIEMIMVLLLAATIVGSISLYWTQRDLIIFLVPILWLVVLLTALYKVKLLRNYNIFYSKFSKVGCSYRKIESNVFLYTAYMFEPPQDE